MSRHRLPPEWEEFGAYWSSDGLLHLREWQRGFTIHELRALFFECQQARTLKNERDAARRDLEALTVRFEAMESRAAWYRQQLTREARLYPLFHYPARRSGYNHP